jgi:hypothetical protein
VKHVRKQLTYANVMSSIAVFMALGGAAAIATSHVLPGNSVGPRQLQPRAVKTGYIDRNAVRVGKIGLEAVRAGKLAKNAVPTNRLRDNAVASGKIAKGAVTASKLGPITTVEGTFPVASTTKVADQSVQCPSGSIVVGGGVQIPGDQTAVQQSVKFENGWRGGALNNDAAVRTLTVQAYCLGG